MSGHHCDWIPSQWGTDFQLQTASAMYYNGCNHYKFVLQRSENFGTCAVEFATAPQVPSYPGGDEADSSQGFRILQSRLPVIINLLPRYDMHMIKIWTCHNVHHVWLSGTSILVRCGKSKRTACESACEFELCSPVRHEVWRLRRTWSAKVRRSTGRPPFRYTQPTAHLMIQQVQVS